MSEPFRVDRRTAIKWMLAAAASLPCHPAGRVAGDAGTRAGLPPRRATAPIPTLTRIYTPGDLWPLTLAAAERAPGGDGAVRLIIPGGRPFAERLRRRRRRLHRRVDQRALSRHSRRTARSILEGLGWLETEATRRFGHWFSSTSRRRKKAAICDDICYLPKRDAASSRRPRSSSRRFRDLTAGGFYTTPAGMKDLGYVGNVALARFDGPPPEVLAESRT